jgi:hypothetical protein
MDFVGTSITWHVYAIVVLVLIMINNLFAVLTASDYITLVRKLKIMTPIYHSMNAVVAYTGGIIAAYSHDLSITIILMLSTTIFVMILEIKRYKKMRVIKLAEVEKQEEFVKFAKKIYMMEIGAIMFTYVVSKVF